MVIPFIPSLIPILHSSNGTTIVETELPSPDPRIIHTDSSKTNISISNKINDTNAGQIIFNSISIILFIFFS